MVAIFKIITSLHAAFASPRSMPPLSSNDDVASYKQQHKSTYGAKQNHPTTYDDNPVFKGPLQLQQTESPDLHRNRIHHYYRDNKQLCKYLDKDDNIPVHITSSTSTNTILKAICDHLARSNAPVDVKEVTESMEFYLRSGKRLIGAAKRVLQNNVEDTSNSQRTITIKDLCCGHGLTGMLFLACLPPGRIQNTTAQTILVDQTKPQSHSILRDCISEICPWVSEETVTFISSPLEKYTLNEMREEDGATIVISTHACGSLTDKVVEYSIDTKVSSIAVMPCCYTGTDRGAPYGIRRMLGVSLSADIRRSFHLQDHDYHVDFASIPKAITPMNRIILAERRV